MNKQHIYIICSLCLFCGLVVGDAFDLCSLMTEIYGVCSPELIENYINQTGGDYVFPLEIGSFEPEGEYYSTTFNQYCVIHENKYASITQCPHTLTSISDMVYINVTLGSYFNESTDLDFAFRFPDNSESIKPMSGEYYGMTDSIVPIIGNVTIDVLCKSSSYGIINNTHVWCYGHEGNMTNQSFYCPVPRRFNIGESKTSCLWETEKTIDTYVESVKGWVDISDKFTKINYLGKSYFYITDIKFDPNETKQLKLKVFVKPFYEGKYDIFIKRSSDSLENAYSTGRYLLLDPEVNTTHNVCDEILYECPSPNCGDNSILTLFSANVSEIDDMETGGADIRIYYNVSGVDYLPDIFISKFNAGANYSMFIEFDNSSGAQYWRCYNKTGGGSASYSNPNAVFSKFTNGTYFDSVNWSAYTTAPLVNGEHLEFTFAGARYGMFLTNDISPPYTAFWEMGSFVNAIYNKISCSGGDWAVGNGYWSYYVSSYGYGGYLPNKLSVRTTSTTLHVLDLVTTWKQHYLYRMVFDNSAHRYNISRQNVGGKGELEDNNWTNIWEQNTTPLTGNFFPVYLGAANPQNMSLYWVGISNSVNHPTFTGWGERLTAFVPPTQMVSKELGGIFPVSFTRINVYPYFNIEGIKSRVFGG